jgi:hypothetical protein
MLSAQRHVLHRDWYAVTASEVCCIHLSNPMQSLNEAAVLVWNSSCFSSFPTTFLFLHLHLRFWLHLHALSAAHHFFLHAVFNFETSMHTVLVSVCVPVGIFLWSYPSTQKQLYSAKPPDTPSPPKSPFLTFVFNFISLIKDFGTSTHYAWILW